jgi:Arc/MetJ-type ribon-helix-helix transcriptional regulator
MRITIELAPEVEKWLASKVEGGAASSADEFIQATLARDFLEEQIAESLGEPANLLTAQDWAAARQRLARSVDSQNESR